MIKTYRKTATIQAERWAITDDVFKQTYVEVKE